MLLGVDIIKTKTACFTGHRPQKFHFGLDESHPDCVFLKQRLYEEIEKAIADGYDYFISGMTLGVDTWAAEAVLALKKKYPHIKLEALLSCVTQADNWSGELKEKFINLLAKCDCIDHVSLYYTSSCMHQRNRYMVDKSSLLIAVYNGAEGGTQYTIEYAQKKGVNICRIVLEKNKRKKQNILSSLFFDKK